MLPAGRAADSRSGGRHRDPCAQPSPCPTRRDAACKLRKCTVKNHPGGGVCARQRGRLGRYERRYCKPCVSTALRHSVPPTVASVALSAGQLVTGQWRKQCQSAVQAGRHAGQRAGRGARRSHLQAPIGAPAVKRPCWVDPVTCPRPPGAGGGTLVVAFPRRCRFVPSREAGVKLERPQRRAGRRGRGRTSLAVPPAGPVRRNT